MSSECIFFFSSSTVVLAKSTSTSPSRMVVFPRFFAIECCTQSAGENAAISCASLRSDSTFASSPGGRVGVGVASGAEARLRVATREVESRTG